MIRDTVTSWFDNKFLKHVNKKERTFLTIRKIKLVFNIAYHPNLSNLNDTMSFLHLLLTPDQEHQQVFYKIPITGFRRAKSLKDILVRESI